MGSWLTVYAHADKPPDAEAEPITLIPYGATTLRIAAFPWVMP